MDYTIIGNEVNLAARLESHAEIGGILLAHETHSLVKDTVMAEEGDALTVKGFAKPVRTYNVVGLYDDLAEQGRIIRKEQAGVRILVDLNAGDRADAIGAVEDVLSQLKCAFRRMAATDSDLTRPPIPIDRGHRFRAIAASLQRR